VTLVAPFSFYTVRSEAAYSKTARALLPGLLPWKTYDSKSKFHEDIINNPTNQKMMYALYFVIAIQFLHQGICVSGFAFGRKAGAVSPRLLLRQ